ncbi:capsule assembly Wzi family protein [Treponema denticola]|uniref:capsule assembly Wzi family protein n=1 Tax=Treponema denticola TaxID=158 RepID=UPI0020A34A1F|nr:capsule assembly Wzi family protein [Treponema denticola]UTC82927.1 capsule assembly Wzi family protein [Treponema denticola]
MKTIRKYRQAFLLSTTFCMLFFALTFPCGAQEAGGTLSEYQAADNSDDEKFTDDSEDDSAKPVFTVGGKLETAHGLRWNKGAEYSLSRSIAQIKGEVLAGSTYAFLSASAEYNYRNPARTGFKLNEAYFRYSGEIWDLSFGRQLINWGQADGFSLTNVLSAKDSSAFLALSSDDTKLASDSIRLRFFHDIFTFEAVAVPFFTPNKLPRFGFEDGAKSDLYYIDTPDTYDTKTPLGSIPIKYTKTETKPKMFTDTEAAARFSFFLPGIDFSVSGFYGWDKNPEFIKQGEWEGKLANPSQPFHPIVNKFIPANKKAEITLNTCYNRISMVGIDAAIPAGDVTVRLEAAWMGNRKFEPKQENLIKGITFTENAMHLQFNSAIKKHQLLALAGLDWIKNSWTLSAQYFEDLILDHKDDIERPMHRGFVSLNISKTFLRDTLKVSTSGAVDINYGSTSSTYSVDYSLTDNMHVILGGDLYTKGYDGKGDFAQLNKISSIWVKGRFNW